MDRVFSLEEISDQFWPPPQNPPPPSAPGESKMNRSPSEWAFEKFLQEAASSLSDTSSKSPPAENDVVEVEDPTPLQNQNFHSHGQQQPNGIQPAPTASFDIPVDSEDYQAFLKSRLNLACAAVALTRAPFVMAQTSAAPSDCASQASANSQSGSRPPSKGSQDKDVREFPALPTNTVQKNIVPLSKSTGSGSSRDLSDDDEAEGEDETTENMDPSDAKRVRRMLSNRESARRSRRRKQAHLTELETQVAQLRLENSSLVKRLTDISQKYSEATVDNRVLKANVETLRAKVKMADESVKRVTGMNPLIQAMSEISMMSFPPPPFNDSSPSNAAAAAASDAAAVPVHNDHPPKAKQQQQHLYQPAPSNPILTPQADNDGTTADSGAVVGNVLQTPVNSAVPAGGNKTSSSSLQRVASLEHLQKRIIHGHGGTNQYGTSQCNGGEL